MNTLTYIASGISLFTLAAHFLRNGEYGLLIVALCFFALMFVKRQWVLHILSLFLLYGSVNWLLTAYEIHSVRVMLGENSSRMFIILGAVSGFSLFSAALLQLKKFKSRYRKNQYDIFIAASFVLTAALIITATMKVSFPILLLDRYLAGFGWIETFFLSLYASFITETMLDKSKNAKLRRKIWMLFSIVFFVQLILGLVGYEVFLMTGKLHLPVPAVILLGPLYRWELSFMVFLFLSSVILVGPAWCSHLCYLGIWDNLAADKQSKPRNVKYKVWQIRIGIFLLVSLSAIAMNILGISGLTATIGGLLFGVLGIVVMVVYSKKSGNMIHCTMYCPIGLLAVFFGKINPFRIRITDACDNCMKCHFACRYNALSFKDIQNQKPNINCTLCGDCISPCEQSAINYQLFKLKPDVSRAIFIALIVSVHAVFLGLGRI